MRLCRQPGGLGDAGWVGPPDGKQENKVLVLFGLPVTLCLKCVRRCVSV